MNPDNTTTVLSGMAGSSWRGTPSVEAKIPTERGPLTRPQAAT